LPTKLPQGHALKGRTTRNPKEIPALPDVPSDIALGDVQRNGNRSPPQLIDYMIVFSAGKRLREFVELCREIDRPLIDFEFFKT
jgi:hypothetical protein